MRLSDLKTGDEAYIIKVKGHGGFRKRIVEMGFIKGQRVDVLQSAPLQDPVKYKVMGYEVSLRRQEAEKIEVSQDERDVAGVSEPQNVATTAHYATHSARHTINVALVGNPNCGKTSLFNFASGAHERVGNYSGVTVDAKEGHADFEGYHLKLVDLPGTYSLSAYSPEELYVRKQLVEDMPDVIINVIDSSNIERNLYLTTQLMDMHLRVVCALNMFDETERRGDSLNIDTLSSLMGMPMVPTSFKTGRGLEALMREVIHIFESQDGQPSVEAPAGDDDAVDIRPVEAAVCTVAVVGGCGRNGVLEAQHLQGLTVECIHLDGVDWGGEGEPFEPSAVVADEGGHPDNPQRRGQRQLREGAVAEGASVDDFDGIAPGNVRQGVTHKEGSFRNGAQAVGYVNRR